jgi:hypothetical protein
MINQSNTSANTPTHTNTEENHKDIPHTCTETQAHGRPLELGQILYGSLASAPSFFVVAFIHHVDNTIALRDLFTLEGAVVCKNCAMKRFSTSLDKNALRRLAKAFPPLEVRVLLTEDYL